MQDIIAPPVPVADTGNPARTPLTAAVIRGRQVSAVYSWTDAADAAEVGAIVAAYMARGDARVIILHPPPGWDAGPALAEILRAALAGPSATLDAPGLDDLAYAAIRLNDRPGALVVATDCPHGAAMVLPEKLPPGHVRVVCEVLSTGGGGLGDTGKD